MENENSSVLHHVEVCVQDERKFLQLFITGFGFTISHFRSSSAGTQWVLRSGRSIFVVTKHLPSREVNTRSQELNGHVNLSTNLSTDKELDSESDLDFYPYLFCTCERKEHTHDTVFNVALEVKNVDKICKNIKESGGKVIQEPTTVTVKEGTIHLAIVDSKCKNVVHSIIDKSKYSGTFLPGFIDIDQIKNDKLLTEYIYPFSTLQNGDRKHLTNFVDHISIVCREGESKAIIEWYEKSFSMKRFFSNSQDTIEDGFVLEDAIGLRLKALQYWKCAETGVTPGVDLMDPRTLKIVIAEPLPNVENGQIQNFLLENRGPGVQHIALHSNNIVSTVREMKERGVSFRRPPPTYYDEITKLNEILEVSLKKSYDEFCESGVLLDVEEDQLSEDDKNRYLLQIFTFPIFEIDTFFMEVIQRYGATGFGAGNISALARSIFRYQEELRNRTTHQ